MLGKNIILDSYLLAFIKEEKYPGFWHKTN